MDAKDIINEVDRTNWCPPRPFQNDELGDAGAMTELEKYLFDVQGFLNVKDVLSSSEVYELNQLIDAQDLPQPGLTTSETYFGQAGPDKTPSGWVDWDARFCGLLCHPRIMPILHWLHGTDLRLNQVTAIHARKGTKGQALHAARDTQYYVWNGRVCAGLTVVAWHLRDSGPEQGGFCCIPGTHKTNYPFTVPQDVYPHFVPKEIHEAHEDAECVIVPESPAGSVTIFSEALTHGSVSWKADHERRALLLKYSPFWQVHVPDHLPVQPTCVELTDEQKRLYELFTTCWPSDG